MMKLSQKVKTGLLLSAFCFAVLLARAQNDYKYRAAVQKVDSTGFYKISLQPGFVAKSESGLVDLRLMDGKKRLIPYVNSANAPLNRPQAFMVLPQVETLTKTDSGTSIVVENKTAQPISRIWLKLKNTAVIRTMNLAGSDDLNRWFAIEEGVPLGPSDVNNDGSYVQEFDFPASSYHYLKILVNDKNKTPVKFLSAGIYVRDSTTNNYQPVVPVSMARAESGKQTVITISLNDNYQVNKVHLNITAPKYFKRSVSVFVPDKKTLLLVNQSELNSAGANDLFLSVKTNRLVLHIDNADNLPLTITGAQVYQTDEYIISYLEAGQSYYLLTGKANAEEPNYDLKFFTDSLKGPTSAIKHLAPAQNPDYQSPVSPNKHDYTLLTWGAIILALLLLSWLTWKMAGEVNGKKAGG